MDNQERVDFFDNAKFLLISLVVLGHLIEPFRDNSPFFRSIYIVIYLFHMPCFIMLSGYFAKKREKSFELIKFLLLYILFQIIFTFAAKVKLELLHPLWILWYLFAWIIWNLSLKFIPEKRKVLIVISAFIIGLVVGYHPDISYYLSLSRIISLYPFFLLGYYSDTWWIWKKKRTYQTLILKMSGIILLSSFFLIVYLTFTNIDPYKFIYYSYPYNDTESPLSIAWLFRLASYGASTITGFAFFLLVPQKKMFFTRYGRNTLQVYLLHACVLYPLYGIDLIHKINTPFDKLLLLIVGFIMIIFLCSPIISFLYRKIEYLVDPKKQIYNYLNKKFPNF